MCVFLVASPIFSSAGCQPALVRAGMTFYSPNLQLMPGKGKESCKVGPYRLYIGFNMDATCVTRL